MSELHWNDKDLGPVDAYALAVAGGYEGTKEQWIAEIAGASTNASNTEAYAKGTRGGEAVTSDDPAYHNNAKYYNEQAALEKAAAQAAAETASAAYNVNLLAPNYDATTTYKVGDHVIYSGGYYECISAISTAEAWTAAHWRQLTVGAESSELKSALDETNGVLGFKNYKHVVKNNSGTSIPSVYSVFDYSASEGDTILFGVFGDAPQGKCFVYVLTTNDTEIMIGAVFKNTYKKFVLTNSIKQINIYCASAVSGTYEMDVRILDNENYVDIQNNILKIAVAKNGTKEVTAKNLQILEGYENLLNPQEYENNKLIAVSGELSDNNSYLTTGFIPVTPGETYLYTGRATQSSESGNDITYNIRTCAFYDSSKTPLDQGYSSETTTPIVIPDNVFYIRFSVLNTIYSYRMFIAGSTKEPYSDYGEEYYKIKSEYCEDWVTLDDLENENEFVKPSMTTFMHYSRNMVNPATVSNGFINQGTGAFDPNDNHRATDFIPVVAGTTYGIIGVTDISWDIRYCWYDSNKTRISGELTDLETLNYVLTAPTGAEYIRFSTNVSPLYQPYYFAPSLTKPTYEPYGSGYVKPEYIQEEDVSNILLNLPSKIYATVGYETNIYFENIVENWEKYHWNVDCNKGKQMERGYTITPTSSDVGTYTITVTAYLNDSSKKTVTSELVISSESAGSGTTKKIIILGDSTTANGYAVSKLNENFSGDPMNISTLGTRGTAPNNHEGRSGWTFNDYFTKASDPGDPSVVNPFYNPTTQTFDASYYFTNTGIAIPDWFFINLGINDTFGYLTDESLNSAIPTILARCDAMIESVKSAGGSIKIGLCITIPPNHSQDAFGKAYSCGQSRDRYKRNNEIWVSKLIEEYSDKENERVYLIPIHTNLDTVYNMGMETLPVNARNTSMTYQSPIGNGGVHPVIEGYWQIADIYTAFLKGNVN